MGLSCGHVQQLSIQLRPSLRCDQSPSIKDIMRSESVAIHKDYTGPHSVVAVVGRSGCLYAKKKSTARERRGEELGSAAYIRRGRVQWRLTPPFERPLVDRATRRRGPSEACNKKHLPIGSRGRKLSEGRGGLLSAAAGGWGVLCRHILRRIPEASTAGAWKCPPPPAFGQGRSRKGSARRRDKHRRQRPPPPVLAGTSRQSLKSMHPT